ncbi:MAG: Ku protein [Hyphomicrobium sp.]
MARRAGSGQMAAPQKSSQSPRPRSYWKGFLRLSLVSISVELYAATTSNDHHIAFHQIHKPSGKRVRYEKVVPGLGPIKPEDIVRGFEIGDDTYVVLEPDELEEVKLASKRTIDLVQFADATDLDPRYFDRPYYLVPEGNVSTEGFLVVRAALESAGKVGLGQMTMRGREYLVAVVPCGRGLVLETLRYADEIRAAEPLFEELPELRLDKEMVALASELIERKSKPFDVSVFTDHYAEALAELVERKRKGKAIVTTEEPGRVREPGKVIDLMDALKKSVGQDLRGRPRPAPRRVRGGAGQSGQKRTRRA